MFPTTLTNLCFLFVNLSSCLSTCLSFCLAAKGSREEGVDEEKIEKDAKVRSKNMRKTRATCGFLHDIFYGCQTISSNFNKQPQRSLLFIRNPFSISMINLMSQRRCCCLTTYPSLVSLQFFLQTRVTILFCITLLQYVLVVTTV